VRDRGVGIGHASEQPGAMHQLDGHDLVSQADIRWAEYPRTVSEAIAPLPQRILYCGMSIGYLDSTLPQLPIPRAPLSETATFLR
jgi:hypothetical protein